MTPEEKAIKSYEEMSGKPINTIVHRTIDIAIEETKKDTFVKESLFVLNERKLDQLQKENEELGQEVNDLKDNITKRRSK